MKGDERGAILRSNFQEFFTRFRLPDPQIDRPNGKMIRFPLVRRAAQTDADDVAASIGCVESHFFQRQVPEDFAANSVGSDHFDGQQRALIGVGEFCAKIAPIFAANFLCFHKFNFKSSKGKFLELRPWPMS